MRNEFRPCGRVMAIYRGGVFQCYWDPRWENALYHLNQIVTFLNSQ